MLAPDTTLNDRYRLLESIGSGGMASVYKAQDLMLRRLVAVKLLHPSLTDDESFLERFQREAHAAASLSHPNIVTVHDIGQDERHYYIVMEYVDGQTLKQLIRADDGAALPVARTLDLAVQICAGIGYAHRAGLVHCDVKAQNVLITRDDRVKVADFGIARAVSQASLHGDSNVLLGTPQYIAPEQAAGEPATPASDVYSIGILLFEMLTGRLPFTAESVPALVMKHMHEQPPSISALNAAVPAQLAQIVGKVLSKEPAGRYRTAGQLERILRSYRESSQEDTGPIAPVRLKATEQPYRVVPVAEQKTQLFVPGELPQRADPTPVRDMPTVAGRRPAVSAAKTRDDREDGDPGSLYVPAAGAPPQDMTATLLAAIAVIALLGLIPLWFFVARSWNVF